MYASDSQASKCNILHTLTRRGNVQTDEFVTSKNWGAWITKFYYLWCSSVALHLRERERERAALKQGKKTDAMSEKKKCREVYGPPGHYTPTLPTTFVKL